MKSQTKILFPAYLTYFLDFMGFSIVFPIFGPMVLDPNAHFFPQDTLLATKSFYLSIILVCFPIAQFFAAPVFGEFADIKGRKKTLLYTVFGTSLGYLVTACGISFETIPIVIMGRTLAGLSAGNTSTCMAAIADLSDDEHTRARRFGYISFFGGIAFVVGVIFSGFFSSEFLPFSSFSLPIWIVSGLSFCNFLCVWLMFQETLKDFQEKKLNLTKGVKNILEAFSIPKLSFLFFFFFTFISGLELIMSYLPVMFSEHYHYSRTEVVLVFVFFGILWAIGSSYLNKYIIKGRTVFSVLYVSILLIIGAYFSLFFAKGMVPILIVLSLLMLIYSYTWPNSQSEISSNADAKIQGKVMGITSSIVALGEIVGILLGGYLFPFGTHWMYLGCFFISILGFASLAIYRRKYLTISLFALIFMGCEKKAQDFANMGEWIQKKMIEELQYVQTYQDLKQHQKKLEQLHNELVDCIEQAKKSNVVSIDNESLTSNLLKEEMIRVLLIENAPQVFEEIQKEALYRLDHLLLKEKK